MAASEQGGIPYQLFTNTIFQVIGVAGGCEYVTDRVHALALSQAVCGTGSLRGAKANPRQDG